jgi:REP element-mobilizing transposase RayT
VMYGHLREDIRGIIRQLCEYKRIEILEGSVSLDHVHMCVVSCHVTVENLSVEAGICKG